MEKKQKLHCLSTLWKRNGKEIRAKVSSKNQTSRDGLRMWVKIKADHVEHKREKESQIGERSLSDDYGASDGSRSSSNV